MACDLKVKNWGRKIKYRIEKEKNTSNKTSTEKNLTTLPSSSKRSCFNFKPDLGVVTMTNWPGLQPGCSKPLKNSTTWITPKQHTPNMDLPTIRMSYLGTTRLEQSRLCLLSWQVNQITWMTSSRCVITSSMRFKNLQMERPSLINGDHWDTLPMLLLFACRWFEFYVLIKQTNVLLHLLKQSAFLSTFWMNTQMLYCVL